MNFAALLQRCAERRSAQEARMVLLHMKKSGFPHLSLGNKLVDAFLKCGNIDDARYVFDEMPQPHIVAWNAMVSSYIRCRRSSDAVALFGRMLASGVVPDEFTFSSIFRAFSAMDCARGGRMAHGQLTVLGYGSRNLFVGSSLVFMYSKLGRMDEARVVFNGVRNKDVVLMTAMIVACAHNGEDSEALRLFADMVNSGVRPNEFTFASVLASCGDSKELQKGKQLHSLVFEMGYEGRSSSVATSLLTMYSKCGVAHECIKVFYGAKNRNAVTWTAIIACLVTNHMEEDSIYMFRGMTRDSASPNEFTFSAVLSGCSALSLFEQGKSIHACAVKYGLEQHRYVGTGLVDMYGKCGHVAMARLVLDNLQVVDLVSTNSMIYGYAQNGYGLEAVEVVESMRRSRLEPNGATFVGVLSACSSAGLLEEGRRIFKSIVGVHGSKPSLDHYACMVDLLGRVGRVEEAEEFLSSIESPDKVQWRVLLGACKVYGKVDIAERAARKVLELDPGDDGSYVLLCNTYAYLGMCDRVRSMKLVMKDKKIKKDPAMSWVEVDKKMHTFMAGDDSHAQAKEIYEKLGGLIERTKELGYVPDTKFVLQEMDESQKERSLYSHSEKLAIAFGLIGSSRNTNAGVVVFKNLRVCGDCHAWIKLVSLVVQKEIIARDAKRFHHFQDGSCSCHDYW